MKASLLLLLLTATVPAFAFDDGPSDVGNQTVRYLSWCEQNAVVQEGRGGQVVIKADCSAKGLRCVETERPMGGERVVYATCSAR
ncbi:MAG: hypothetical protein M9962_14355 [Oligoflexia bacterium]|nr:hypothetical protein [Oligoflexia bacterium]